MFLVARHLSSHYNQYLIIFFGVDFELYQPNNVSIVVFTAFAYIYTQMQEIFYLKQFDTAAFYKKYIFTRHNEHVITKISNILIRSAGRSVLQIKAWSQFNKAMLLRGAHEN